MKQLQIYSVDTEKFKSQKPIAKKIYVDLLIDTAAEGIFNALDKDLKSKYTPDKISDIIKNTDKDKNGIITEEEAKKDIDNIFGLQLSEDANKLKKVQASVDKNLELADIKGLKIGLDNWTMTKHLTISHTSAEDIRNMFSNKSAVKYYSDEMGKNSDTNKHLVELFKARGITVDEIKKMGFSEKVLNDILRLYQE